MMRLKELRNEKGLTVSALVEKSGIPRRTIEDIERTGKCRFDTACKLADALNVKLDDLRKKG